MYNVYYTINISYYLLLISYYFLHIVEYKVPARFNTKILVLLTSPVTFERHMKVIVYERCDVHHTSRSKPNNTLDWNSLKHMIPRFYNLTSFQRSLPKHVQHNSNKFTWKKSLSLFHKHLMLMFTVSLLECVR